MCVFISMGASRSSCSKYCTTDRTFRRERSHDGGTVRCGSRAALRSCVGSSLRAAQHPRGAQFDAEVDMDEPLAVDVAPRVRACARRGEPISRMARGVTVDAARLVRCTSRDVAHRHALQVRPESSGRHEQEPGAVLAKGGKARPWYDSACLCLRRDHGVRSSRNIVQWHRPNRLGGAAPGALPCWKQKSAC